MLKMGVKHYAWKLVQAIQDTKKKSMRDVKFYSFPKPYLQDHEKKIKCRNWIKTYGRSPLKIELVKDRPGLQKIQISLCCMFQSFL